MCVLYGSVPFWHDQWRDLLKESVLSADEASAEERRHRIMLLSLRVE